MPGVIASMLLAAAFFAVYEGCRQARVRAELALGEAAGLAGEHLAGLAERCAAIAARTAAGRMPGPREADCPNRLDAELLGLTGRADAPLVADFHTDANSGQDAGGAERKGVRGRPGRRGRQ